MKPGAHRSPDRACLPGKESPIRDAWQQTGPRRVGLLAAFGIVSLVCLGVLGCSGAETREAIAAHHRETKALNAMDPEGVLGGRRAEAVIARTLSQARCPSKEKGLFHEVTRLEWIEDFAFDSGSRDLTLKQQHSSDEWLGNRSEGILSVSIAMDRATLYIDPPHPKGNHRCWKVQIKCAEPRCVTVDGTFRDLKEERLIDERRHRRQSGFWTLWFERRDLALDAFAALAVLARAGGAGTSDL